MDDNLRKQLELVQQNTILEVVHGSHAYGTNLPTSDVDIKGVCLIPDKRLFLGKQGFEQQDGGWETDKVIYHLPKFMQLAGECNPNIIEMLWVDRESILQITDAGWKLREARDVFLSKKARHTFSGYAHAQLQRIKAHKRWLDNPPTKPTHDQFKHRHVLEIGPLGSEEFSAQTRLVRLVRAAGDTERMQINIGTPPIGSEIEFQKGIWFDIEVEKYDKTGYEHAMKEYHHYEAWKKGRNEARAELEAKHHFDTKHAMHLVRLLRMGWEIMTEGKVLVKRPDAKELLGIRNGEWTYERLVGYAEELDAKLEEAYQKSTLPYAPNWTKIEELQIELIEEALNGKS